MNIVTRFVMETDTPDIFPYLISKNGDKESINRYNKLNEPKYLSAISEMAAGELNLPYELFCQHAYKNSQILFGSIMKGNVKE